MVAERARGGDGRLWKDLLGRSALSAQESARVEAMLVLVGLDGLANVPVAALGIVGYAAIALFAFLRQRWLTVLFSLIGLGFALYLSHIEAHVLQVWCLYCVISQVLIALIFLLSLISVSVRPRTSR